MAEVPFLFFVAGPLRGQRFPISEAGTRIGRDASNEIQLNDNGASRHHARVLVHGGQLWVQDMGSRNGVYINEQRIQSQELLNVGDKVQIGGSAFEIRVEAPRVPNAAIAFTSTGPQAPQEAQAPPAPPRPKKRWRLWPFLVAAGIVALLIVAIAARGGKSATPAKTVRSSDPVLDLLMTTTQDPAATASAKGDKAGAPTDTTLAGGLANLLADPKATAKPEEKWSPPPPNVSSAELVERGHQLYRANRLHDALVAYHQGLMVDSTCEICKRRIDRLNTEIEQAIRQQLDAGLRYYNSLQYEQAITAWETVLLLSPNPESQPHKQAREYMEKAQASLKRQY